jgi:hypothetical protein
VHVELINKIDETVASIVLDGGSSGRGKIEIASVAAPVVAESERYLPELSFQDLPMPQFGSEERADLPPMLGWQPS